VVSGEVHILHLTVQFRYANFIKLYLSTIIKAYERGDFEHVDFTNSSHVISLLIFSLLWLLLDSGTIPDLITMFIHIIYMSEIYTPTGDIIILSNCFEPYCTNVQLIRVPICYNYDTGVQEGVVNLLGPIEI